MSRTHVEQVAAVWVLLPCAHNRKGQVMLPPGRFTSEGA